MGLQLSRHFVFILCVDGVVEVVEVDIFYIVLFWYSVFRWHFGRNGNGYLNVGLAFVMRFDAFFSRRVHVYRAGFSGQ